LSDDKKLRLQSTWQSVLLRSLKKSLLFRLTRFVTWT